MNKRLSFVATVILALFALGIGGVEAGNGTRTFTWLAGDAGGTGFLCNPGQMPACPDAARASSTGDVIDISGFGELTIHPKSINGGGTFSATALEQFGGNVEGTWEATQLLSFKSYGPSPILPENFLAGLAMIRIQLMVDGNWVADGILRLGCILPMAKVPGAKGGVADPGVRGGALEGVRVNVQGGLNFNLEEDPRATLFIETTPP
jgi:hypothetical protein